MPLKWIVACFDLDLCTNAKERDTKAFLKKAEEEGRLKIIEGDFPRTVIVSIDRVYISPLSMESLTERMNQAGEHLSFWGKKRHEEEKWKI